jgi:EAL domain-containing protein (putative c-di-GMP-specific phosphodiesterase class I)
MLGCDVVQGYFFSHPLQVAEYEALLIDDRLPSF